MKKISVLQISVFMSMLTIILILGVFTALAIAAELPLGEYRGVTTLILILISVYLYAFLIYRIFLQLIPLQTGVIEAGTRAELAAQVNILFYLLLFNSLIRTHFIPVPLLRLVYLALGARLGNNTYSAGVLLDPPLTSFGDNCIIGHDAVIFCHAIEGDNFALFPVKIGDNVTIGAMSIVMADVVIEEGAIISAGAVVTKGTHIKSKEVWGGVPAKKIK